METNMCPKPYESLRPFYEYNVANDISLFFQQFVYENVGGNSK